MNRLSGDTQYTGIRTGIPGHSLLVWKEGDPIPAASEEMETFYALEEQWSRRYQSLAESEDWDTVFMADWYDSLENARLAVPEWQE